MISNKIFWIIWGIFLAYSIFLSPRHNETTKSTSVYIRKLMLGPWNNIDPYVIALFWFLGIWPFVYMSVLLVDGQNQQLNGSLASLLAMALGGFILLPYFALRRSETTKQFRSNLFVRIFESKLVTILLMIAAIGFALYALKFGDIHAFLHEFRTHQFIHIMTIDFFVVSFLFPGLVEDDLKRRKITNNNYFRICFLPLLGPLIYLYQRPPLEQKKSNEKNLL
ncbi:unnamed protein product [Rotaria magnacalcarata]